MSKLKAHEIPNDVAQTMLRRANAAKVNTYPITNKGYVVAVLIAAGNIYEGVSYKI